MPLRDSVDTLELCITQLINEAKSRDWTVEKTKHKIIEMFVNNNEKFWVEVYNERWLDKVSGFPENVIDDYRKSIIVGEGEE